MLPCCWSRSGGPNYIELQMESSDECDSEEELLEETVVDGGSPVSVACGDTVDRATTTSAQSSSPSGWSLTDAEAGALTRAGFAILRVCDYIQLALKHPSLLLHRGGRSVEGNSTVPIYTASNGANHSYFVNGTEIPQWIYPCGVTPNGTFPDGHRPFRIYDPNVDDYIQPEFLDYGMYFSGGYNNLSHTISRGWWGEALITEPFSEKWHTLPYGFRGKGDWIPVHFGDHTPQYPFASVGISNQLSYDGGTCPKWIFNATHFFGGGYLGWEEPGFDPIYPCGIRPDGLFTNAWVGFANGSVPNNTYPFGHFPNNNFPYLDYFFNPGFNHPELYLAVLNNRTEALSNFTSFLNASETGRLYHPIPRNSSDEFAPCFGIYDYQSLYAPHTSPVPVTSQNTSTATTHHSLTTHAVDPSSIDRALIQAGLWSAQLGAELAVVLTQGDSCARRRIAQALYL